MGGSLLAKVSWYYGASLTIRVDSRETTPGKMMLVHSQDGVVPSLTIEYSQGLCQIVDSFHLLGVCTSATEVTLRGTPDSSAVVDSSLVVVRDHLLLLEVHATSVSFLRLESVGKLTVRACDIGELFLDTKKAREMAAEKRA